MNQYRKNTLPDSVVKILVDDILGSSDKEIMNDACESHHDINFEINRTRSIINSAIIKSRKSKLVLAKNELEKNKEETKRTNVLSLSIKNKRDLINATRKSIGSLTLAARNEEQITELDADSILLDLIDLGVIDENGNIK